MSSLLETILLPLIEQVSFGASQIDNLRTAITLQKQKNFLVKYSRKFPFGSITDLYKMDSSGKTLYTEFKYNEATNY